MTFSDILETLKVVFQNFDPLTKVMLTKCDESLSTLMPNMELDDQGQVVEAHFLLKNIDRVLHGEKFFPLKRVGASVPQRYEHVLVLKDSQKMWRCMRSLGMRVYVIKNLTIRDDFKEGCCFHPVLIDRDDLETYLAAYQLRNMFDTKEWHDLSEKIHQDESRCVVNRFEFARSYLFNDNHSDNELYKPSISSSVMLEPWSQFDNEVRNIVSRIAEEMDGKDPEDEYYDEFYRQTTGLKVWD